MLFHVMITDSANGDELAGKLQFVGNYIRKNNLLEGFTLKFDNGTAKFFQRVQEFKTCAEAEIQLKVTLEWRQVDNRYIGSLAGVDVAEVYVYPTETK